MPGRAGNSSSRRSVELRRLVAALETAAIEQRRTEQRLLKEAQVSGAALRQSEAMARAVLESASEGILLIDANGRIILVNRGGRAHVQVRARRAAWADARGPAARPHPRDASRASSSLLRGTARPADGQRARPGRPSQGRRRIPGRDQPQLPPDGRGHERDGPHHGHHRAQARRGRAAAAARDALPDREAGGARHVVGRHRARDEQSALGIITSRIEVMLLDAEEQNLPTQVREDLNVLHRATQRVARIATNLRSFARQAPREHAQVEPERGRPGDACS